MQTLAKTVEKRPWLLTLYLGQALVYTEIGTNDEEAEEALAAGKIQELRIENVYLADMLFKKENTTLDPEAAVTYWIGNNLSAERKTLLIDENKFNTWSIGQNLSSNFDHFSFWMDGKWQKYVARVEGKSVIQEFFFIGEHGAQQVSPEIYTKIRNALSGQKSYSVHYSGLDRTYYFTTALNQDQVVMVQPLLRGFITLAVQNSSFTIDPIKHARNAILGHTFEIEVPITDPSVSEVLSRNGTFNVGAFFWKGSLSSMSGQIQSRNTRPDQDFLTITLENRKQLVVARKDLRSLGLNKVADSLP